MTGWVEDIRPYVEMSKVFVVPLKSGSGTRLKILDAMAMGIPVVSTSIGAEGLDVKHGENILLADFPDEFCSAILKLLRDNEFSRLVIHKASELVRQKYAWKSVWGHLLNEYREVKKLFDRNRSKPMIFCYINLNMDQGGCVTKFTIFVVLTYFAGIIGSFVADTAWGIYVYQMLYY